MPATATTPSAGQLNVGDTWLLGVLVLDDVTGTPTAATVTAEVTGSGAPVPADVEEVGAGRYLARHVLTEAVRHTAQVSVSGDVTAVVLFAVDAVTVSALPDLTAVKNYLGTEVTAQYGDTVIQEELDAERVNQAKVCRVGAVYPADLGSALKRRVLRALALRSLPLAVLQNDADGGASFLPSNDPEVKRLEGPYRKVVFG